MTKGAAAMIANIKDSAIRKKIPALCLFGIVIASGSTPAKKLTTCCTGLKTELEELLQDVVKTANANHQLL